MLNLKVRNSILLLLEIDMVPAKQQISSMTVTFPWLSLVCAL
jgi:hypothetical protein